MLNKITSSLLFLMALMPIVSSQERLVTEITLEGSAKDKSLEMSGHNRH